MNNATQWKVIKALAAFIVIFILVVSFYQLVIFFTGCGFDYGPYKFEVTQLDSLSISIDTLISDEQGTLVIDRGFGRIYPAFVFIKKDDAKWSFSLYFNSLPYLESKKLWDSIRFEVVDDSNPIIIELTDSHQKIGLLEIDRKTGENCTYIYWDTD